MPGGGGGAPRPGGPGGPRLPGGPGGPLPRPGGPGGPRLPGGPGGYVLLKNECNLVSLPDLLLKDARDKARHDIEYLNNRLYYNDGDLYRSDEHKVDKAKYYKTLKEYNLYCFFFSSLS